MAFEVTLIIFIFQISSVFDFGKAKYENKIEKLGCFPLMKNICVHTHTYTRMHTHTYTQMLSKTLYFYDTIFLGIPLNALLCCVKVFFPYPSLLFHSFLSIFLSTYYMPSITKGILINNI